MPKAHEDLATPVMAVRLLPPVLFNVDSLTSVKGVDGLPICCGSLVSKKKHSGQGASVEADSEFKMQ